MGRRCLVQWRVVVHSGASLDSGAVTSLDEGCEVVVAETVCLESGRERSRLEAPVEGWVSSMFLTGAERSFSKRRVPERWGGPLPAAVVAMIGRREGNEACFDCGLRLIGLRGDDGESAFGDCDRGVTVCGFCARRGCRSLELDAFSEYQRARLVLGGNSQLRRFLVRHPKGLREYRKSLAYEAGDGPAEPPPGSRVAAGAHERRVRALAFDLVETHGGRAAVTKAGEGDLRVGDYVVGVEGARVWRFGDVIRALEDHRRDSETWVCLVVRRLDPKHPDALDRVYPTPDCVDVDVVDSGVSYASHASVIGYWQQPAPPAAVKVVERPLRVLALGPGKPLALRPATRPGGFVAAVVDENSTAAVVVGVNERRDHLQYDDVLAALDDLRRPLLVLLAVLGDDEADNNST